MKTFTMFALQRPLTLAIYLTEKLANNELHLAGTFHFAYDNIQRSLTHNGAKNKQPAINIILRKNMMQRLHWHACTNWILMAMLIALLFNRAFQCKYRLNMILKLSSRFVNGEFSYIVFELAMNVFWCRQFVEDAI